MVSHAISIPDVLGRTMLIRGLTQSIDASFAKEDWGWEAEYDFGIESSILCLIGLSD